MLQSSRPSAAKSKRELRIRPSCLRVVVHIGENWKHGHPPPFGWPCLNTDGSVVAGKAAAGGVIGGDDGSNQT
ncbi:unnamed protein product [Linum trigynum]|uniref:Uncharacterized protein n=1 Tax=Linum trigynum TaxID=586398 RepID=A0AAV2G559_9ROSI